MLLSNKVILASLAFAAPASALVAQPALRSAVSFSPSASRSASPNMLFGGAGRSFIRAVRKTTPTKFPGFGSRAGGIRGCDGGDGGGDGGEVSPQEPEEQPDDGENPLAKAWKRYEELLDEKPLLMKALTSFTGFALGDFLAQKFIQKTDPFDWKRLFRLASFGFLVHGTTSHWFYGMLDGKMPGKSAKVVFTKVFIDQVLWNPCFGIMFFSYVALLELKGIGYVIEKTRKELLNSVTGSWKVWPAAHAINFRFIPSSQRVLYINTIQVGYNCFLSLLSNRDE
jgi:protein Mpv17